MPEDRPSPWFAFPFLQPLVPKIVNCTGCGNALRLPGNASSHNIQKRQARQIMATEKWEIDAVHSSIGFSVRHMVVAKVRGQFSTWSGNLLLDTADLTKSKVDVKIDVASINTHNTQRDGHLKSPDFFDVEKFPTIEFQSS